MPTYGQRPDDVVQDSRGNALSGVTISLYSTESDALAGGAPLGTAVTDHRGRWQYAAGDGELWARVPDGTVWQVASTSGQGLTATSYTYNPDGTVATETIAGVATSYTYNANGTVATATRGGTTLTYTYNSNGTIASVA